MAFSKKSSSIELGHDAVDAELDPMFEWMLSPHGRAFEQARQLAGEALEEVRVDGGARRLLWPDGVSLTIDQSVRRIGKMAEAVPGELTGVALFCRAADVATGRPR